MKPGTIIELPDKRRGTIVYHDLDGYGFIWGEKEVDPKDLPEPEALLRDEFKNADWKCVGKEYKIIKQGVTL